MNGRVEYLDIVKALGIIFVVIGHSGWLLGKFIYLFHMPLFFFISGYFYQDKYTLNFSSLILKRIKTLYIPFLKFEVSFLLLHNVFYIINIYSDDFRVNVPEKLYSFSDYTHNFLAIIMFNGTESLLAPLWFLSVLFIVNILFWVICKLSIRFGENWKPICAVLCFCIGNLLTKLKLGHINSIVFVPELLNVSLVAVFIYYLGNLYKKYEDNVCYNNRTYLIIAILLLCLLREYGGYDMRLNSYPEPAFMLMSSMVGIYLTIYMAKVIQNERIKIILKYIGNHTIPIMALHLLSFKVISLLQIKLLGLPFYMLGNFGPAINKSLWGILYTLVGLIIPLFLIYLKERMFSVIVSKYSKCAN